MDWLLGDSNRIPPRFVQVHLAAIELRQVWRGVNAPTFPFNLAGQRHFQLLGLSIAEILYLIAVAVLWYLCGILAAGKKSEPSPNPSSYHTNRIVALCDTVLGSDLVRAFHFAGAASFSVDFRVR